MLTLLNIWGISLPCTKVMCPSYVPGMVSQFIWIFTYEWVRSLHFQGWERFYLDSSLYLCLSKERFQLTISIRIHLRLKGASGLSFLPRDSHHLGAGPSTFVHFLITVFSFMINARSLFYRAHNLWQAGNKSTKWTSYSKKGITVERSSWHKYMLEVIQTRGKLNTFPR